MGCCWERLMWAADLQIRWWAGLVGSIREWLRFLLWASNSCSSDTTIPQQQLDFHPTNTRNNPAQTIFQPSQNQPYELHRTTTCPNSIEPPHDQHYARFPFSYFQNDPNLHELHKNPSSKSNSSTTASNPQPKIQKRWEPKQNRKKHSNAERNTLEHLSSSSSTPIQPHTSLDFRTRLCSSLVFDQGTDEKLGESRSELGVEKEE
ncbi:hypothetical protein Droror1_Dr00011936 [Drosera rotundifolia]